MNENPWHAEVCVKRICLSGDLNYVWGALDIDRLFTNLLLSIVLPDYPCGLEFS